MSCEALWSIEFTGFKKQNVSQTIDSGGGIVLFETDKVYGGDASFYYLGEYEILNGKITVKAEVKRFNDRIPALYKDDYSITFSGKYNDKEFEISGNPDGDTDYLITVRLKKIVELP